ncbi:hypothetical protein [Arthrobacter sp. B0490]|uniref:hypothetical protein n=1 Tax=Arthrobacter sp. B0490 TaxID=2058891 RepID=UPI000CE37018|nr:hypothetical protein [Arthrobacter sp. B0490]
MIEDVSEPCQIGLELLASRPDAPPGLRAPALGGMATLCWILGRNKEAISLHEELLEAFMRAGNEQGAAWAMLCVAVQAMDRNDGSAYLLTEAVLFIPQASLRTRIAALICLSRQNYYDGHYSRALELCAESAALARQLGDRLVLGVALTNLAESTEQVSDLSTAEDLLREALLTTLELGSQANLVGYLESLASVYVHQARADLAIRVLAAAAAYPIVRRHPLTAPELLQIEELLATARTQVGPIRFGLAWAAGRTLTLPHAIQQIL